jgi:glyoxylase-like metal-dependent hydrolase (beta-lactamase superfamily II)
MIRIVRVLAPNPGVYTLDGTNTWIVGEDPAIVIDPGPDDEGHLAEVARLAGRVAVVLLTHDHEDHAEGAAGFARRVDAPLVAVRFPDAERLEDGATFAAGGGASLRAVATPGHSADHVVFVDDAAGALFTGDAVLGRGTSFLDPPDGDLGAYLGSLDRMGALGARTIHPGHGPVVLDAAAKLREYREHREERTEQILSALADGGSASIDDLVATIYAAYREDVRPLAARSVLAHLLYLEGEHRVARDGHGVAQRWSLATPKSCARCGRPITGAGTYCRRCLVDMLQGAGTAATAGNGDTEAGADDAESSAVHEP